MRERGRLAGKTIGNRTYWPAWQFTEGGLREDLGDILEVIAGFTSDAVATDRIMRLPRVELAGRSFAGAPLTATSTRLADHRGLLDQLVIIGGGTLGF